METLGFNSPSHNPENELPQWQQKIADAEDNICQIAMDTSAEKSHPDPESFCQELENLRINCEGLMGKEDGEKTTNRTNLHEWLKKGTQRALMTQIWVSE